MPPIFDVKYSVIGCNTQWLAVTVGEYAVALLHSDGMLPLGGVRSVVRETTLMELEMDSILALAIRRFSGTTATRDVPSFVLVIMLQVRVMALTLVAAKLGIAGILPV